MTETDCLEVSEKPCLVALGLSLFIPHPLFRVFPFEKFGFLAVKKFINHTWSHSKHYAAWSWTPETTHLSKNAILSYSKIYTSIHLYIYMYIERDSIIYMCPKLCLSKNHGALKLGGFGVKLTYPCLSLFNKTRIRSSHFLNHLWQPTL